MKKFYCLLGLCSLALTACSVDETIQEGNTNAVKFKTTTAVRAASTTTNNLESFSVWAWNGNIEFMDDVIATRSSNGSFTTSPLYFWPTGSVDFYALTPSTTVTAWETDDYGNQTEYAYIGGEITDEGDDEGTGWTYTGNVAKAKIANGDISLDVYVPGSYEDQIDICYAVVMEQSSGTVSMNFRHALSQIVFKAMNTNSDMIIDIQGISICDIYKHGTYSLPTVSTTTNLASESLGTDGIADSQGKWDENEDHKARFVAGIAATTLEGVTNEAVTLTSDNGSLMLLPQEVEAWDPVGDANDATLGAYIRINCAVIEGGAQIWPNANEADDNGVIPDYAEIAVPIDIAWEEGWRYTYTIVFGDGLSYYPPDDPNYSLDGTPVLVPINFDVSVDGFQTSDDINVDTGIDDDIVPYLDEGNFQAYALATFDTNGDGRVSQVEAAEVTRIYCGGYYDTAENNYWVEDFTGIEHFPNLTSFESNTALTLDLSKNTELTDIHLGYSNHMTGVGHAFGAPIEYLDLSANTKMTSVPAEAFWYCDELKTVILPSTVTTLGAYCFAATAITDFEFPESLTTIETYAFELCSNLKAVKIPDTVTSIGSAAFYYCTNLESVTWSAGMTEVPGSTFRYDSSLTDVVLPGTIESIGGRAFSNCKNLANITIYATTPPTVGSNAFYSVTGFVLYVPEESVDAYAASSDWSKATAIYPIED